MKRRIEISTQTQNFNLIDPNPGILRKTDQDVRLPILLDAIFLQPDHLLDQPLLVFLRDGRFESEADYDCHH
jgi:hypothetical protein